MTVQAGASTGYTGTPTATVCSADGAAYSVSGCTWQCLSITPTPPVDPSILPDASGIVNVAEQYRSYSSVWGNDAPRLDRRAKECKRGEGGAQELRSVAEQMHCVLLHPLRLPLPAPPASYRLPQKELVARLPDVAAVHWRRGGDRWRRRRAPVRKPRATPPALPMPLRLDRSLAVLGAVAISCRRPTPSATSHRRQPACLSAIGADVGPAGDHEIENPSQFESID